ACHSLLDDPYLCLFICSHFADLARLLRLRNLSRYYRVLYLIIPEVHRNNGACQTVYRSCALITTRFQPTPRICPISENAAREITASTPATTSMVTVARIPTISQQ